MPKIINAVAVGYWANLGKWPDTQNTDYSDILAKRQDISYVIDDEHVVIRWRWYPIHRAYAIAGHLKTPSQHPLIDNTKPPPSNVIDAMISELRCIANDGCTLLVWEHFHQCYPPVAACLRQLYKHSICMQFDDCPGSTETKTMPVAGFFDSALHGNIIWTEDGCLTQDIYKNLGVPDVQYVSLQTTSGFKERLAARGDFTIDSRIKQLRERAYGHDIVFVGGRIGPRRISMNSSSFYEALSFAGIRSKIRGWGMAGGELLPNNSALPGGAVADAYLDSFAVLNVPFIGLMGSRPFDAWASGTLLIQHDAVGELRHIGVLPGVHYVEYDGSAKDLINKIRYYQSHFDEAECIIRAGYAVGKSIVVERSRLNVVGDILRRYKKKLDL